MQSTKHQVQSTKHQVQSTKHTSLVALRLLTSHTLYNCAFFSITARPCVGRNPRYRDDPCPDSSSTNSTLTQRRVSWRRSLFRSQRVFDYGSLAERVRSDENNITNEFLRTSSVALSSSFS